MAILGQTMKKLSTVASSPPCETFSTADASNITRDNFHRDHSMNMENPLGSLRQRPYMRGEAMEKHLHRETTNYCAYGEQYAKATDSWTSCTAMDATGKAQAMADAAMERVDKDKERGEQANSITTR
jgi:hypothetical protein